MLRYLLNLNNRLWNNRVSIWIQENFRDPAKLLPIEKMRRKMTNNIHEHTLISQSWGYGNSCYIPSVGGWMVAFKKKKFAYTPDPLNVTLFGKRIFADVIKLRILRRDQPEWSRWVLNLVARVLTIDIQERPGEEKVMWGLRQRPKWGSMSHRTPGATQSWKRPGKIHPFSLWKSTTLVVPWFQTSGLWAVS